MPISEWRRCCKAGQQVEIETTYSQAREGLKGLMGRAMQDREDVMVP